MHREVREQANAAARTAFADGRRLWAIVLLGLAAFFVGAQSGWALGGETCMSIDNHIYYIVHTSSAFAQVTSVALTDSTASACSEQGSTGTVLTSLATGLGSLLPNRMRTSVLTGMNDGQLTCIGDFLPAAANGKGILKLHTSSDRFVSVDPTACTNDSTFNPASIPCERVTDVHNSDFTAGISGLPGVTGTVPAAMDLASVSRTSVGCATSGTTMVFPNPAGTISLSSDTAGEQSGQTVTLGDTTGSTVGNVAGGSNPHTVGTTQPSPDGFTLQGGCYGTTQPTCEVIVFIASLDGNLGFAAAAAGFTTDSNLVQSATESTANNGSFLPPTRTPTPTPPLPTPTPTPSPIFCVGDCNGDGQVTVDEILTMIEIALNGDNGTCPAFGAWCEGPVEVTIDCILDAVNDALTGCPVPPPLTPTTPPTL